MKQFFLYLLFLTAPFLTYSQYINCTVASGLNVCPGGSFKIAYHATGTFNSGNIFTAQLYSSFGTILTGGSIASTANQDSILVTVPANASGFYYIRVNSSSPAITGSNSSTSIDAGTPFYPGIPNYISPVCTGNKLHLYIIGGYTNYNYWTGPNGFTSNSNSPTIDNIDASYSGDYYVRQQWIGGCQGPATKVSIVISPTQAPSAPSISSNSPICSNDTLKLIASDVPGATIEWYNSNNSKFSTNQSVTLLPGQSNYQSGTFSARSVANGCYSDSSRKSITINPIPSYSSVKVQDDIDLVCSGSTILLNASSNTSLSEAYWTLPDGTKINNAYTTTTVTTQNSGKFTFTGKGYNGCINKVTSQFLVVDSTNPASYQTGEWQWANGIIGTGGTKYSGGIKRDNKGNLYVTFSNSAVHSKFTSTDSIKNLGGSDVMIAKYDIYGNFKWAKVLGSTGNDNIIGNLVVDSSSNVFVAGTFAGATAQIGSVTLTRQGNNPNLFLVKIDSTGNIIWVKQGDDSSSNSYYGTITFFGIDAQGSLYISLTGSTQKYLDGIAVPAACILKFNPDGSYAKTISTKMGTTQYGPGLIAIDNAQNIYLLVATYLDPAIMKIDPSGNILSLTSYSYLRAGNNINKTYIRGYSDFTISKDGFLYAAMPVYAKNRNEGVALNTAPFYTTLAKFDLNGNVIWHRDINESNLKINLDTDNEGNAYLCGSLDFNYSCSNISSIPYSNQSYVTKYRSDGTWDWTKPFNLSNPCFSIGPKGEIFYSAQYVYKTTLGNIQLPAYGSSGQLMIGKVGSPIHVITNLNKSYCEGQTINIDLNTDLHYSTGNSFNVELSDTKGKFIDPVVIGTLSSTTSGSITCQLPVNIFYSSSYRVRVVSTNPVIIGNDNGFDITINKPVITTGTLSKTVFCGTTQLKIPFSVSNSCNIYSGNVFTAQLSDKDGYFTHPLNLGSISGITSDTITATIPDTISFGTNYKIRVVGSVPLIAGLPATSPVTIYGKPVITAQSTYFCEGNPLKLLVNSVSGATYNWAGPNGFSSTSTSPTINALTKANEGNYKVTGTIGNCKTQSSELYVKVYKGEGLDSLNWNWAKNTGTKNKIVDLKADNKGHLYAYASSIYPDTIDGFAITPGLILIKKDTLGKTISAKTIFTSTYNSNLTANKLLIDSKGNIYLSGTFKKDISYHTGTVNSIGETDAFLARITSDSIIDWVYRSGAQINNIALANPPTETDEIGNMNFDQDENVVMIGIFTGYYNQTATSTISISHAGGIKTIPSEPTRSGMVYAIMTYSQNGTLKGYKPFHFDNPGNPSGGGPNELYINIDKENNFILSGRFTSTLPLDSVLTDTIRIHTNLNYPTGRSDGFIAKFDQSWKLKWAKVIGGYEYDGAFQTTTDKTGAIYVLFFSSEYNLQPNLIPSGNNFISYQNNFDNNYLIKFDSTGMLQWVRDVGLAATNFYTTEDGDTYLAFYRDNTFYFGNCLTYHTQGNRRAAFTTKINKDGHLDFIEYIYSSYLNTNINAGFTNITLNKTGNIFLSGYYAQTCNFDTIQLSNGFNFIARLDQIDSLPVAHFTYSDKCFPDTIQFTNDSQSKLGPITTYSWDFGDTTSGKNNISNEINPQHQFSSGGTYTVKLTITNSLGKINSYQKTILIKEKPFVTIQKGPGFCTDKEIEFTSTSTNYPTNTVTWKWHNIGTYASITGNANSNTIFYSFGIPGTYNIKVSAAANGCIDTILYPIDIKQSSYVTLKVENPCQKDTVRFIPTVLNPSIEILKSHWNFGNNDQSPETVGISEAKEYYSIGGPYIVTLFHTNQEGCVDSTQINTYFATPYADFTLNGSCIGSNSTLTDLSITYNNRSITNRTWVINPGNNIINGSATTNFVFTTADLYTVELIVQDNMGCKDTSFHSYQINGTKPLVTFNSDTLFTEIYQSYQWFRNDTIIQNATNQYWHPISNGFYKVAVEDENGCALISDPYNISGVVNSTKEETISYINIYPNPTKEKVFLEINAPVSKEYTVELVDKLGRVLISEFKNLNAGKNLIEINTNYLPSGLFQIKIWNNDSFNTLDLLIYN